jgi:hypothetical protein
MFSFERLCDLKSTMKEKANLFPGTEHEIQGMTMAERFTEL